MKLQLTDEQQDAVAAAIDVVATAGHMALLGPAGTGKTTVIRAAASAVISSPCARGRGVLLLAPTHKARRQFEAAPLPEGTETMTVQRFCNVRATRWRDEERFKVSPGNSSDTIESIKRNYALVIVDEASMVSNALAAKVVDICNQAKVGVLFAGDPYQLPPVSDSADFDLDDLEAAETHLSEQFINAPRVVTLQRVMRHGGPILQFATALRSNWSDLHDFPVEPVYGDESALEVLGDTAAAFIRHFRMIYEQHDEGVLDLTQFYQSAPRALCYTNRLVGSLTQRLRTDVYGQVAAEQWQPGEIIMFPSYTRAACGSVIYSSTDAIIESSEIIDISETASPIHWKTPARKEPRICNLDFHGQAQRLTVQTIMPNGVADEENTYTVHTPLIGDNTLREQYNSIYTSIRNVKPSLGSDHRGWEWLFGIKNTYLTPVTSAFVLTVHKSQGSTFDHVYVSRDLLLARDRATRNPLLYVAATRAAKSITFGVPHAIGA